MACYLCAYQQTQTPKRPRPLPRSGPANPNRALGMCCKCCVLACAAHGARYARFECAMCNAASAAKQALLQPPATVPPDPGTQAAVASARLVGQEADENQRQRVTAALVRISKDLRRGSAPKSLEFDAAPNLVFDLDALIQRRTRAKNVAAVHEGWAVAAEEGGQQYLSIPAVAGAVRGLFEGAEPREVDDDTVIIATGALLFAMTIADEPDADEAGGEQVASSDIAVKPPWDVTHPILLDPVIWLLATAYVEA